MPVPPPKNKENKYKGLLKKLLELLSRINISEEDKPLIVEVAKEIGEKKTINQLVNEETLLLVIQLPDQFDISPDLNEKDRQSYLIDVRDNVGNVIATNVTPTDIQED